jgi:hypothetical protein
MMLQELHRMRSFCLMINAAGRLAPAAFRKYIAV